MANIIVEDKLANSSQPKFDWVFISKGIGIILVVIGHFSPTQSPEYWGQVRSVIYSFHMPLFFLLSGFLYNYHKYSYASLIGNKVKRLMYPFVTVAIIFFIIRYVSEIFFTLQNPIDIKSIYALFLDPVNSYVPLLWFIYSLFLIFLIYPLMRRVLKSNAAIILIFIILNIAFGSDYIIFGKMVLNMPFFIFGVILREWGVLREKLSGGLWYQSVSAFVIFLIAYQSMVSVDIGSVLHYPIKLAVGIIGSIFIINISIMISSAKSVRLTGSVLAQLGYYSMAIYFFHTFFESGVRIIFYQVLTNYYQFSFETIALIAIVAGVVTPFIIEKNLLRRFSVTKKYVIGVA